MVNKLLFLTCSFLSFFSIQGTEKIKLCFYTNWAQYRNGAGKFLPENIDPSLCSHINYAFAKINLDTLQIQEYEWNDDQMIARVNALKKQKASLKTIISVGGWTHDQYQHRFSKMVTDTSTRKIFIDSAVLFLKKYSFDGLSYDWEWPGNRGSPATDKQKFTLLLQETFEAFKKDALTHNTEQFILTASLGAGPKVIATAYELPEISKYVNWVTVMTYDLHGSWENTTGCSTAMKGKSPTVPESLRVILNGGVPAEKVLLGLAGYGRTFQLTSSKSNGLNSSVVGAGLAGKYTAAAGSLAFYEICSDGWTSETSFIASKSGAPYASKGTQWVGYDTLSSVKNKVTSLINVNNLRGFGFWSLDLDDFTGQFCNLGKYPLLKEAGKLLDSAESFHRSKYNTRCNSSPGWRYNKVLDIMCQKHCVRNSKLCPKYMCKCY